MYRYLDLDAETAKVDWGDPPTSLQGAAAKIRYHMFYRVGAAMTEIADVESSEEYRLLLRAAETLEGAAGETRKAA